MWQAGDQSRSEIPWLIIHCAHSAVKAPLSKPVLFKPARLPLPRLPAAGRRTHRRGQSSFSCSSSGGDFPQWPMRDRQPHLGSEHTFKSLAQRAVMSVPAASLLSETWTDPRRATSGLPRGSPTERDGALIFLIKISSPRPSALITALISQGTKG